MKEHISASQLTLFGMCGEAWKLRYIDKISMPPTPSLIKGTTGHAICEHINRCKLDGREPSKSTAWQIMEKLLDDGFSKDVLLSKKQQMEGKLIIKDRIQRELEYCIPLIIESLSSIMPRSIESAQVLSHPDWETDIKYVMDVETTEGQIIDYKFTGKEKSQIEADNDMGLTLYAMAYYAKNGVLPNAIFMDNFTSYTTLAKGETKAKHKILMTKRDLKDFHILFARIDMMLKMIKAGHCAPAPIGSWKCSQDMCEYWNICQYVNQERLANQEESEQ